MIKIYMQTRLREKIFLVIFGVFIALAAVEVGLRLSGLIVLSLQEARNMSSARKIGTYRILCLGESTTQNEYPPFLEAILNQNSSGIKFSVIDKGLTGANTTFILSQLEAYLDKYRPDLVITMMGINDQGQHLPYEKPASSKALLFARSVKSYKLARLLWLHMLAKAKEIGPSEAQKSGYPVKKGATEILSQELKKAYAKKEGAFGDEQAFKKSLALDPRNSQAYLGLGWLYKDQGRLKEAEECLKKSLSLDPKNSWAWLIRAWLYGEEGRLPEAEEYCKKSLELDPENSWACLGLGWIYRRQNRVTEAMGCFKKSLELNPDNQRACLGLGWIYREQGQLAQAEECFRRSLELDPKNSWAYLGLGWVYRDQGRSREAEEYFRKPLVSDPENSQVYLGLGWVYKDQKKFQQAEEYFKKSLALDPENNRAYLALGLIYKDKGELLQAEEYFKKSLDLDPANSWACLELAWVYKEQGQLAQAEQSLLKGAGPYRDRPKLYAALADIYQESGQDGQAQRYRNKAKELGLCEYHPVTRQNYHKLKEATDKRKIRLVCVQYPMRDAAILKNIFNGQAGIIFVDNEHIFKEAVKREGYKAYFRDIFAGDFGHCTEKGNRLLADNIADSIVKEMPYK